MNPGIYGARPMTPLVRRRLSFSSQPSRNRSCLRDCRTGLFRSPQHSRRKMKSCARKLSPNWRTKSPILESLTRAFWRNALLIPDMSGTLREAKNAAKTRSSLVVDAVSPNQSLPPRPNFPWKQANYQGKSLSEGRARPRRTPYVAEVTPNSLELRANSLNVETGNVRERLRLWSC